MAYNAGVENFLISIDKDWYDKLNGEKSGWSVVEEFTEEPAAPYRIRHQGAWFYIDETDLESKRLFQIAVEGYQSRLGSIAPDAAPLISLPLGN